eukprot:9094267-Pyramimonas_sp.AAC.2
MALEGDVRPFSLTEDSFDQTTFMGRCRKMMQITDPRVVLISEHRVRYALKLLREFQVGPDWPCLVHLTASQRMRYLGTKQTVQLTLFRNERKTSNLRHLNGAQHAFTL